MAWIRLIALLLWVLVGGLITTLFYYLGWRKTRDAFVRWGYAKFLKIARVKVEVVGELSKDRPLMLVTNHVSYMDIPVLASSHFLYFTPKAEIARWPVIGFFCKAMDCVFIDRRISSTGQNKRMLEEELAKGRVVCLFPEGTTSDGKRVLPFRSSYFSLEDIEGRGMAVQAASIRYTHINNLPVDSTQIPKIAWYGDMYLLPHILEFLSLGRVTVRLTFHEPALLSRFESRKALANHCRQLVAQDLQSPPNE